MEEHIFRSVFNEVRRLVAGASLSKELAHQRMAMFISAAVVSVKRAYPTFNPGESFWADLCSDVYETCVECLYEEMWN